MPKRIKKTKDIPQVRPRKLRLSEIETVPVIELTQAQAEAQDEPAAPSTSAELDISPLVNSNIELSYVSCDLAQRFRLLFTFVRANFNKRVVVFLCGPALVKYFGNAFKDLGVAVAEAHERLSTPALKTNMAKFASGERKVLLCSNSVADKVDFQGVAWSVHYDVPSDVQHLIRTWVRAKAEGAPQILMVLTDFETGFAQIFQEKGVRISEFTFPLSKLAPIADKLSRLVTSNFNYAVESREAFQAYVCFYYGHSFKEIFDGQKLDLKKVALSLGLSTLPKVSLKAMKTKQPSMWKKHHRKTMAEELKALGSGQFHFGQDGAEE